MHDAGVDARPPWSGIRRGGQVGEHRILWSVLPGRAGFALVAATLLLLGAWSLFAPQPNTPTNDLSQQLEQTLLAAVDQEQPIDSAR